MPVYQLNANYSLKDTSFDSQLLLIFHEQYGGCSNCGQLSKDEKGLIVFQDLLLLRQETQIEVLNYLEGKQLDYKSFFVSNFIHIRDSVSAELLLEMEELFGHLLSIHKDEGIMVPEIEESHIHFQYRDQTEWNLQQTGAVNVWDMGYRGQGVVIGGQDTGYDWQHPDLYHSYRAVAESEGEISHDYHWFDAIESISPLHQDSTVSPELNPCGLKVPAPCDDHRHGTHTMGIMAGGNHSGSAIGVAPAANWIGCRNMERGYGSISTYLSCFEWFLAPTRTDGTDPRPEMAPHVINNSWVCPEMEGCNPSNYRLIKQAIFNLREAGIFVVASAGNNGNHCGSISNPPSVFPESFTVGSTNRDSSISNFSSFGPVETETGPIIKPDAVAPGNEIRSSVPDGGYRIMSGTSMAGPHVAGLAALLISARPDLAGQVSEIEDIIRTSAEAAFYEGDCGVFSGLSIPNFAYGYGRINMKKAVEMALGSTNVNNSSGHEAFFRVFPNPASKLLQIECTGCNFETQYSIRDLSGKTLRSGSIKSGEISVESIPSGYYFLTIQKTSGIAEVRPLIIHKASGW